MNIFLFEWSEVTFYIRRYDCDDIIELFVMHRFKIRISDPTHSQLSWGKHGMQLL